MNEIWDLKAASNIMPIISSKCHSILKNMRGSKWWQTEWTIHLSWNQHEMSFTKVQWHFLFLCVCVPVSEAYWVKTSAGFGPSMIKTSIIPLSDIQRTSVWGASLETCTKSSIFPNIVWEMDTHLKELL